jgi:hypothetical protein
MCVISVLACTNVALVDRIVIIPSRMSISSACVRYARKTGAMYGLDSQLACTHSPS